MIPIFPKFSKLKLNHRKDILDITSHYHPYSDFNFTSLWTYNTDDSIQVSLLHNNLVVRFCDYQTLKPFYSFIGTNFVKKTIQILITHAQKMQIEPYLKLIPDIVVQSCKELSLDYDICEDADNHDYIISVKDIVNLPSEKYRRKKHLVDCFKKKYSGYRVEFLNLQNKDKEVEIYNLFSLWEKRSCKNHKETENELIAIKRLISSHKDLDVFILGIYYQNKLIAFNIYEVSHKKMGISAFQKADKKYTGIYAALSHEAAKHLYILGCTHVNYEQDLGIEGLRLSKSLWKPVQYLKKYIIKPKTT